MRLDGILREAVADGQHLDDAVRGGNLDRVEDQPTIDELRLIDRQLQSDTVLTCGIDQRRGPAVGAGLDALQIERSLQTQRRAVQTLRKVAAQVNKGLLNVAAGVEERVGHLVFLVPLRNIGRAITPTEVLPSRGNRRRGFALELARHRHRGRIEPVGAMTDEGIDQVVGVVEP